MDNGKEFYQHTKIAKALKAETYFCRPYHSWEKGLNENTNGLIRQYFPKQTDFRNISDREIRRVQDSWTTGREKHLAAKRQVFYSWICSNHRYHSVALEMRIQGGPNLFQITNRYPRPPTRAHDRRVSQEPAQPLLCFCDKYELKKA